MRLFPKVDGSVDRFDRAGLLTIPFDLSSRIAGGIFAEGMVHTWEFRAGEVYHGGFQEQQVHHGGFQSGQDYD